MWGELKSKSSRKSSLIRIFRLSSLASSRGSAKWLIKSSRSSLESVVYWNLTSVLFVDLSILLIALHTDLNLHALSGASLAVVVHIESSLPLFFFFFYREIV